METRALPPMKNAMKDRVEPHALPPIIATVDVQAPAIVATLLLVIASMVHVVLVAMIRLVHVIANYQI